MVALAHLRLPIRPRLPPPARPPPIDLIRDITGAVKIYPKNQQHSTS